MKLAAPMVAAIAVAAAGGVLASAMNNDAEPTPRASHDDAWEAPNEVRPRLIVTQELGEGQGYPVEGALSYLRLIGPGVVRLKAEFSHPTFSVTYPLRIAGRFRLTSYQRVCSGSCGRGALAPPSERCSVSFSVKRRQLVRARSHIAFGQGCRITLRKK